ncbi:ABC transporter permease [Aggregicoccus sp. 17bor-14]|uniref:ABC transporter permease n=1 Tax=Myxococcaceae TaxID=31 RepID=UPI00129C7840|nr:MULTISPECIES: ABC transporter permease [Myxococcaceae]MBF5043199.1 ABC transporter permease [Simulacricoccus sp. 17bor-14]MRI88956.1 ABC transporter permease [Aggregicoccus sp. 17bor-14]
MAGKRIHEQLKGLIFRAPVAEEVDAELKFHLEMVTKELVEGGMSPEAARAEALRRFGDVGAVRKECGQLGRAEQRERQRAQWLSELVQDVGYALRQLRRVPGFTLTAVLTLALGIGATTAIFSAVRSVVLRPFAWAHPERVMLVQESYRGQPASMSVGNYVDLKAGSHSFQAFAAEEFTGASLQEGENPERLSAGRVTHDFFSVFGVRPQLGRTFLPEEDAPGASPVVVLSHGLWTRRFGADPSLVGKSVRIDGQSHTVVGVMPRGFDPTASGEHVWLPAAFTPARRAEHDEHLLLVVGLLQPGVSGQRAQGELQSLQEEISRRFPQGNAERGSAVQPLSEAIVGDWSQQLLVTLGAVALVLLIACANVANLLLARGASRARELAVRAALGAGRGRIVRQLLTESLVLALLGATVGLALAWVGIHVLLASAPEGIPRLDETRIDGSVLLFALGAALLSSLACGLAPAVRAARSDLESVLRQGARGLSHGRDALRAWLIAGEVALAFTLLVGAGLLVRTALHLSQVDTGFKPEGLVIAQVSLPKASYETPEQITRALERILEQLQGAPGVTSAALSSSVPLGPGGGSNGMLPEGRPETQDQLINGRRRVVSAGFFETLGIPLKEGRRFTAADVGGAPQVIILSEALARQAWPGQRALGKHIGCCEMEPALRNKEVVGIAGDVRSQGPMSDPAPEFYLPLRQAPGKSWDWIDRTVTLVVRRSGSTADAITAMRAAVREVDSTLPLAGITTLEEALRASTATARFRTLLLAVLGIVGLLLAAVGIYGVVAYFVGLRTREIGVRMALGAKPADVLRMLAWQGMRPVLAGLGVGGLAAVWATRLLQASLRGVSPADPVALAAAMALLALVALLATLAPARRALQVDPSRVLGEG